MARGPHLLLALSAICASACAERSTTSPQPADSQPGPAGVLISNAHSSFLTAGTSESRAAFLGGGESLVYISLAPATLVDALIAEVRNRTTHGSSRIVKVVDGGFDPVPIEAQTGDSIDLIASRSDGSTFAFVVTVPGRRPPIVVRTNPAKGRVDVALNVTITVVFSEPMDTTTVNPASVRVLKGGQQVNGSVRWLENSLALEFVPSKPLESGAAYSLVITREVRDKDGDALAEAFESSFTTGVPQNGCPPGYFDPVFGCAPFLTPGPSSISGVVRERSTQGTKPVPNAFVTAWVEYGPWGWSTNEVERTDANGNYTIHNLPAGGQVTLLAAVYRDNFLVAADQPCALIVELNGGNSSADIEVFSPADPMPDAITSLPLLTGTVFEQTEHGRQPVAGADVFYELMALMGRTTTDADGHFSLCRLPASVGFLSLSKTGYTTTGQITSFASVKELHVEVEMKRSP